MKPFIIIVLLLSLPVRTVLAVSSIGCPMMPMQTPTHQTDGAPCPMHADAMELGSPTDNQPADCPTCAALCCAALAPMPAIAMIAAPAKNQSSVFAETLFHNAARQSLERPPKQS